MAHIPGAGRVALAGIAVAVTVAALALAADPAQATDTTLYVATTGCSPTGPGTQTQPYCTISAAAAAAGPGTTVRVAAGTYPEKVTVPASGTASAPITFVGAAGATVTGGSNGFAISGKQYVTISGFTVTTTSSYGISVSSASHITLTGNSVSGAGHQVAGSIAAGIYLSGVSASTVSGNATDHNSDTGIFLNSSTTGVTVQGNEASWNANGYQRNANGINVVGAGNTVTGNITHDNEDSGIQIYTGGNNTLVTDNVSYNNGDHGIDDLNVTGGRIVGNTVYRNCTTGINVEGTSGNYLLRNNIAMDNAVYPAYNGITCNRRKGDIGVWDSAPATSTADSNLVFLTTSGTLYVFGTSYTSLVTLRAATGQESHGLQADPGFVNAAGYDLRLAPGSPAIDSADSDASGQPAIDPLGVARVDDPAVSNTGLGTRGYDDRGAYEHPVDGTPAPQPPTAALSVSPGSGTAPLAVTADASGSTDPQGQALSYTFAFGDGTTVGPQAGATATHSYPSAGSYPVTVTVVNTAGLSATATATVQVSAPTGGPPPAYVSQIATNYSTSVHTSGYVTVWRTGGVAAGHGAVLTVELTGTGTGPVSATDDAGNSYPVVADGTDPAGDRLVLLAGPVTSALAVNQRITVSFPSAATYRITADELTALAAVDQASTATGTSATFSSGAVTTTAGGELLFGAVGVFAGTSPTWDTGWTALTTYAVGGSYLGRGYQSATGTGTFAATGSTSGSWIAGVVALR